MDKFIDKTLWIGKYNVKVFNKKLNKIVFEDTLFNTISNNARDEIIKSLYGTTPDLEIKYLAIGTGTTASSASNTALETEVFRTADDALDRINVGSIQSDFMVQDTDYSGIIGEIGIFCGSTATASSGSGLLLSRINWNYTKTPDEDIYFQRIDIIGG